MTGGRDIADALRRAGHTNEAERLDRAMATRRAWSYDGSADERAVALGLFGSARFDELAASAGFTGWT